MGEASVRNQLALQSGITAIDFRITSKLRTVIVVIRYPTQVNGLPQAIVVFTLEHPRNRPRFDASSRKCDETFAVSVENDVTLTSRLPLR